MNKEKIKKILERLDEQYGKESICYLNYKKDYELLIGTILAAQCTDARVNLVTSELFKKYDRLEKFANVGSRELEEDIKPTGFFREKAKHIISASKMLLSEFSGKLPSNLEDLLKLDGVGRKTANVIRTHIFHTPSIVVDTHVKRVSKRIGLTPNTDPTKIEFDLMKCLPEENWSRYNGQIMALGRTFCNARKPQCVECFLKVECMKKTKA